MSLRLALLKCFEDQPKRVFGIQDLCSAVRKYYKFSPFQEALDPRHPQPRYEHEIRSQVNRLRKEGIVLRFGWNQYRFP